MNEIKDESSLFHKCLVIIMMLSFVIWPLSALIAIWFPSIQVVTDIAGGVVLLTVLIGSVTSQVRMKAKYKED